MADIGRTSNPALNANTFENLEAVGTERMTIQGTVNRTFVLLALVIAGASYSWSLYLQGQFTGAISIGSALVALVFALISIFRKTWTPITGPLYALLEGVALGGLSAHFERQFPGIVMQAAALTFATLFALLAAYRSGLIRATENFRLGVTAATGAIFLVYMVNLALTFFTSIRVPFIHEAGLGGILFSLFVTAVAALNLVLDFDFIERGADSGAPKYMEWYGAFGLTVTLVWLYLEMLRLLSKMNRR